MVVPPAMAERVPDSQLSPVGLSSWARWTCESTPPGVTYAPCASKVLALGNSEGRFCPSSVILPDDMAMSWLGMTSDAVV